MADDDSMTRVIIHLDLDCFYAQVEQRRLKIPEGQPVAVQQWGSLLAVNYEARKFGVERGDFVDQAKKKCPQIHLPHVDTLGENRKVGHLYDRAHQKAILRRYRVASREIFAILGSMVSTIEKASIDEAFMDITDLAKERLAQMLMVICRRKTSYSSEFCQDPANHDTKVFQKFDQDKHAAEEDDQQLAFPLTVNERLLCIGAIISREIRHAVYNTCGYTCSTGIAGNKLLAKLASPLNKPNGQVVVAPRFVASLMKSLPMRKIRGLGGKLGKQLEGIYHSLDSMADGEVIQEEKHAETKLKKLTAHAFLQRCGLAELSKHLGQETAVYVHQICQGNDNNEPVAENKVQVKLLSCVKQFDHRSGSALVRLEQLEYWIRLLCEEMIMRCEDERIENKRFPSKLTIQFTRVKSGEKPRTQKLAIAQDTTVDDLYGASMNVMRLHMDTLFPMASLSMHATKFHDLDSSAVTTISTYFTRNVNKKVARTVAGQRIEGDIEPFVAKRRRAESPREGRRQKISCFFKQPSSSCHSFNKVGPLSSVTKDKTCNKVSSTCATEADTSSSNNHFCEICKRFVSERRDEHADFHFALQLSRTQRTEAENRFTRKEGPLDRFLCLR
ncbi:hypothetical protein PsorP6_017823 [Peronosclerospora sorghi]|uniref:Uncharacterized protein n=1 Tax=Peronosclerospora sorghi TaxID=230839 RepID=A0ACC0WDQ2_9STRA|nr:hypothetical protein PsorP6_017823 [Peronosclerospora sorghi]